MTIYVIKIVIYALHIFTLILVPLLFVYPLSVVVETLPLPIIIIEIIIEIIIGILILYLFTINPFEIATITYCAIALLLNLA